MTSYQVACKIRGEQEKERRQAEWLRWAVASLMTPHYKNPIQPEDLFLFDGERAEKVLKMRENILTAEDDEMMAQFFKKAITNEKNKENGK